MEWKFYLLFQHCPQADLVAQDKHHHKTKFKFLCLSLCFYHSILSPVWQQKLILSSPVVWIVFISW